MMSIKNTNEKYGAMAITFHWIIAALIFFQLGLGLYMKDQPVSLKKLKLFGIHKEYGLLILFLAILRFAWRLMNINPIYPHTMPIWQLAAARSVHAALYGCLLLMPITGWLISSAAGLPVSFFGLFLMPVLIHSDPSLQSIFSTIHEGLAYFLILLICVHLAAVVQHYLIYKDNILRRMLY